MFYARLGNQQKSQCEAGFFVKVLEQKSPTYHFGVKAMMAAETYTKGAFQLIAISLLA